MPAPGRQSRLAKRLADLAEKPGVGTEGEAVAATAGGPCNPGSRPAPPLRHRCRCGTAIPSEVRTSATSSSKRPVYRGDGEAVPTLRSATIRVEIAGDERRDRWLLGKIEHPRRQSLAQGAGGEPIALEQIGQFDARPPQASRRRRRSPGTTPGMRCPMIRQQTGPARSSRGRRESDPAPARPTVLGRLSLDGPVAHEEAEQPEEIVWWFPRSAPAASRRARTLSKPAAY